MQHTLQQLRTRAEEVYDETVNLKWSVDEENNDNNNNNSNSSITTTANTQINSKIVEGTGASRAKPSNNSFSATTITTTNSSGSNNNYVSGDRSNISGNKTTINTASSNSVITNPPITGSSLSSTSPLLSARKFPPRLANSTRVALSSVEMYYGLEKRVNALLSCSSLVYWYTAAIDSNASLLPASVVSIHYQQANVIRSIIMVVLHVTLHRLCLAICPLETECEMISKVKPDKNEMKPSAYVTEIVNRVKSINERRPKFASFAVLDKLILQRLLFAAQSIILREYAKLARKKVSDVLVMQLQVDVQTLQQLFMSQFGKSSLVMPEYVLALIKTGFYHNNRAELLS